MKIAIIHSAAGGFFPRFYLALHASIYSKGNECRLFLPNIKTNRNSNLSNQVIWGTRVNTKLHQVLYKISGLQDIFSFIDSLSLIYSLRKYAPDVIHCHIINDKIINLYLFRCFINISKIPVVWTMHDCRAVTGRCAYFDEIGCKRWEIGCGHCKQNVLYEPTWIDNSHLEWKIRRKLLHGICNLTIVTPSKWLSDIISRSYLKDYKCTVIHNGVDIESFQNAVRVDISKYRLDGKIVILGVANSWEERKGLKVFEKLSNDLPNTYQIVLVGRLPYELPNIISIPSTNSVEELSSLYKRADVFVNPTMADNFPTTNLESLACGTPIVTYDSGGSGECVGDGCGIVVERGDYIALWQAVIKVTHDKEKYSSKLCYERAKLYSTGQYDEYCKLYELVSGKITL